MIGYERGGFFVARGLCYDGHDWCSGRFLGIGGWKHGVFKSSRLHVVIFWIFLGLV